MRSRESRVKNQMPVGDSTWGENGAAAGLAVQPPPELDRRSLQLRRSVLRGVEGGRRGHIGSALSIVEILRVLYDDVLRHDPVRPRWPARDRFLLSKGHGCLALYALLADHGYFPAEELDRFCAAGALLGGHPEHHIPGVEASTGSLGHGLAIGIGCALAARSERAGWHTYVLLGDGECEEGSVWEGALCAGRHRLGNLTALIDYNKLRTYEAPALEPFADKWRSFGWAVAEVDGHDVAALRRVLARPLDSHRPGTIVCHTVKGKGIDFIEGVASWHHKAKVSDDEMRRLREGLER